MGDIEKSFLFSVGSFLQKSSPSLLPFAQTALDKVELIGEHYSTTTSRDSKFVSKSAKHDCAGLDVKLVKRPQCAKCFCLLEFGINCKIREESDTSNVVIIRCNICGFELRENVNVCFKNKQINPCSETSSFQFKEESRLMGTRTSVKQQLKDIQKESNRYNYAGGVTKKSALSKEKSNQKLSLKNLFE